MRSSMAAPRGSRCGPVQMERNGSRFGKVRKRIPIGRLGSDNDQPIKFAKFALTKPGIFHLDRVVFYGEVKKTAEK